MSVCLTKCHDRTGQNVTDNLTVHFLPHFFYFFLNKKFKSIYFNIASQIIDQGTDWKLSSLLSHITSVSANGLVGVLDHKTNEIFWIKRDIQFSSRKFQTGRHALLQALQKDHIIWSSSKLHGHFTLLKS